MHLTCSYKIIIPKPRTPRHQAARSDTGSLQLLPGIKNEICPRTLNPPIVDRGGSRLGRAREDEGRVGEAAGEGAVGGTSGTGGLRLCPRAYPWTAS